MIDYHKHYRSLSTIELVELLAEATQKYVSSPIGESERTLGSYRELLNFLHNEIRQRSSPDKGVAVKENIALPGNSAGLLPGP